MTDHQFRVTVEDLAEGTRQVMEFAPGDYLLVPFGPCHRAGVQAYPASGTHVITVKGHHPTASPRHVTAEVADRATVRRDALAALLAVYDTWCQVAQPGTDEHEAMEPACLVVDAHEAALRAAARTDEPGATTP